MINIIQILTYIVYNIPIEYLLQKKVGPETLIK